MSDDAIRYATSIDVESAGSHALVVRHVPDGSRVLELGCATGSMTAVLRDRGCAVWAVEIDENAATRAVGYAERLVVADLDVADLRDLYAGERFDVVVAADVLEHLRDPGRVLDWLHHRLAPGGRLVASIPNVAHAAVRLALLGGAFPYDKWGLLDHTHLRFFTHDSLRATLASHGFDVVSVERVEVEPEDAIVPFDVASLPPGVDEWVRAQPEALTFQFVVVATPIEGYDVAEPAGGVVAAALPASDVVRRQAAALAELDLAAARLRDDVARLTAAVADRDWLITRLRETPAHKLTRKLRVARDLARRAPKEGER